MNRIVYSPHLYPVFIHEDVPYGSPIKSRFLCGHGTGLEKLTFTKLLLAGEIGQENAGTLIIM